MKSKFLLLVILLTGTLNAQLDVSITSLYSPASYYCPTAAESVEVVLHNDGMVMLNFSTNPVSVSVSVTGPNPVVFPTVVISTGTMPAAGSLLVTITNSYDMSIPGVYTFNATSSLTGDMNPSNNSMAAASIYVGGNAAITPHFTCSGSDLQLTSANYSGNDFQWQVSADKVVWNNIPGAVSASYLYTDTSTSSHTLYFRNITCGLYASNIDSAQIFYATPPVPVNDTLCVPGNAVLTATAPGNISWYDQLTGGTSIGTGATLQVNVAATDTFYAENTEIFSGPVTCTSDRAMVVAHVIPASAPLSLQAFSSNMLTCMGGNDTLNAQMTGGYGNYTYAWSDGLGTNDTVIASGFMNDHIVIVTATDDCGSLVDSVLIDVVDSLHITSTDTITHCGPGSGFVLSSVVNGGDGNYQYQWSGGETTSSITTGVVNLTTPFVLTVNDGCGMIDSSASMVLIHPLPSIGYTVIPGDSVCAGSPVTLQGTGGESYSWTGGITDGLPFTPAISGTYLLSGTDGFGCTGNDSIYIFVAPVPDVSLGADITQPNPPVVLDAGSGFSSYAWNTSEVTSSISVSTSGTYIVTVTTLPGCEDSDTIQVNFTAGINDLPDLAGNIACYPNPTSGTLYVHITGMDGIDMSMELIDTEGRTMRSYTFGQPGADHTWKLDLAFLNKGIYFMVFHSPFETYVSKVIITDNQ